MLRSLMDKRLLWAGFLVVLLAFTLAACDADTGDDATLDEPGVVQEPLGADEGVVGQDDDILGDDEDVVGQDDDVVGDDDVLTDDMVDVFGDDRIGMDEPGIMFDENDAFEGTGRIETINEDQGFFDLGFDDEPNEQVYLREGDTFDNYDFQEGDVVNLRGARENGQIYADQIEMGDATVFDEAGAMSGLDDTYDTSDGNVPSELVDDELGLATTGIVWWEDQFELTGNIDTIEDDYIRVTYPVDGEPVTQDIYLFSTPVGAGTWADYDLGEDDVVSMAGFVGRTGRYYATEAVLDVGLFEEDRPASDTDRDDNGAMDDDADEIGIQWDGDEFSLTGTIIGQPDLLNNMLTVEANGEQYTIYIADTVVYEDNLFAEDLMDGDLVEIEGVRDDTGDMWAHSIELEDNGPFSG